MALGRIPGLVRLALLMLLKMGLLSLRKVGGFFSNFLKAYAQKTIISASFMQAYTHKQPFQQLPKDVVVRDGDAVPLRTKTSSAVSRKPMHKNSLFSRFPM